MDQKLLGKVGLVTGGARGLGRSYVYRLTGLGADVIINDIDLEAYKEYGENHDSYKKFDRSIDLSQQCWRQSTASGRFSMA